MFFFPLKGLIFQTEVEPEEKFFQGGLEKFWKQVSFLSSQAFLAFYCLSLMCKPHPYSQIFSAKLGVLLIYKTMFLGFNECMVWDHRSGPLVVLTSDW